MEYHVLGYERLKDSRSFPIYISQFLPQSEWYDKTVPILIEDLRRIVCDSRKWHLRYLQDPFYEKEKVVLYLNHPLRRFRLCGLVIGWRWKLIHQEDRAFWFLDDCSDTLLCQCSYSLLTSFGLPSRDLSGWTLSVSGYFDRERAEFKVDHIDVIKNLRQEIDFWKSALDHKRRLNSPWALDYNTLQRVYNETPSTPVPNSDNFIQHLEDLHFQEHELQIASPYFEEDSLGMGAWNSDLLQSTLEQSLIDEEDNANEIINLESETDSSVPSKKISLKKLRKNIVSFLLKIAENSNYCSKYDPFNQIYINILLTDFAKTTKLQQLGAKDVDIENIKLQIYEDAIKELTASNLVSESSDILDMTSLIKCYRYIKIRFQSLINMRIPNRTISYEQVRNVCGLQALSNKIILQVCKYFLNSTHTGDLMEWWVEPLNNESFKVFFVYNSS